ncbi:hypothetical protein AGDE_15948 [Angomonas deanei]|uniref:Uncharacterized protein n=1 Tax=Angomonas deanei TaxID=59799 RepID=A0A7G2CPE9_9TRYP|nr:hypothetical protein AGDE_15948 [Angomonas deanei]CAD2221660.1 hypothetical protein, conserved [Angomonas deanei]|eukprot:EPY18075.1 hypothetical protein AGDE_15948 [Angomonas deanei]
MLSIVELLSSHAPSVSVRSLVRRTHGNPAAQREIVVDGVRRATCLTADGVIYARRSLMPYVMEEFKKWSKQKRSEALSSGKKKTSESNEENYNDTSNRNDPTKREEATQGEDSFVSQLLSSRFSSKTTQEAVEELVNNLTPSDYYVEVAPERKVMESFFPNRMFSGVNIAVADVFDVRGFHTRGGLQSTLMMREGKEESPLLSWFKKEAGRWWGS